MWTRTMIGKAEIVLWRKGAAEFRLETWRSCAEYVLGWLHEATR
jgi:sarcosine oxidase subunit gamma